MVNSTIGDDSVVAAILNGLSLVDPRFASLASHRTAV